MFARRPKIEKDAPLGFLSRLRRDRRGNTMAIMAASLVPLVGMIGGGFDLSRLYLVKTRLQHACDAGALAGRKAMGGGTWNQTVNSVANYPSTIANRFFAANFDGTPYGVTLSAGQPAFTENAGKVTGNVAATVPMTLMRVMGFDSKDLSVTCDAEMRLPNTDVMFVLDNTGSMGSKAVASDSQTKIEALKSAVKCFYEIVARLDTDENCSGGAPSGGTGGQVQVRFGFVPYDTNVRVGRLLPTEYFADSWPYQSRERTNVTGTWTIWDSATRNAQSWSGYTNQGASVIINKNLPGNCNTLNTGTVVPADSYTTDGVSTSWPDTETAISWRGYIMSVQRNYRNQDMGTSGSNRTCQLQYRERNIERRAFFTRAATGTVFPAWNYRQVPLDVSGLKAGSGVNWNSGETLPIGNSWGNMAVTWDGCIEERHTVRQTSYSPIPSGANDLDIDAVPSASDPDSLWGPALASVIFPRRASYDNSGVLTTDTMTTFYNSYSGEAYSCPAASKKLQAWPNASDFDTYVNTLSPGSNTYHDIGLLWGARLMSPTGIFASENAYTPQGGEIERHLIFMTDGDACTSSLNYQAYGLAWYDRRQTDPAVAPSTAQSCQTSTNDELVQQVSARANALCAAIKNKNITLWVIWFGANTPSIETQLTNCATPNRFIAARNSAQLQAAFRAIADEISALRLTG